MENIQRANLADRVHIQLADALKATVEGTYDFLFIDAAKAQYIRFFERYTPHRVIGGYVPVSYTHLKGREHAARTERSGHRDHLYFSWSDDR